MKMKWIKTVTTLFNKYKKPIIDHAPQILAAAGVACFVGGTVCAVKETPKAMEKLKEKEALDPDMSVLQKAAVIVPEYKKSELCVATGLVLTSVAWKWEAHKMAEALAALAAVTKDNDRLIAAAKEVVGEEKTKEIVEKKNEFTAEDCQVDYNGACPSDQVVYPFVFPGGREIFMSWAQFKTRLEYNIRCLATNHNLSEYEYFSEMGLRNSLLDSDMQKKGWEVTDEEAGDVLTPDECIDWAYEKLDYKSELIEYDSRTNMPGWKITWHVEPKKLSNM